MSSTTKRLFLVDGSSYMFRAYYAVRHLSAADGTPTNAIFGFANMLLKILRNDPPDYLAVVFDTKAPTFRKEMYPEYKANRAAMPEDLVPQVPVIKELVRGFQIPVLEQDGVEADDIIATLARRYASDTLQVTIVSSDKDLMQIVSDQVVMLDTMKDKCSGPAEVEERFGVPPEKVGDILGLAGDSSDNIPGVPGIGEKTATALIREFGDLETLLASTGQVKGKKRQENLRDFADQARLSRRLVALKYDVELDCPLTELALTEPDREALTDLFKRLEFHKLLQEFSVEERSTGEQYRAILTKEDFKGLLQELQELRQICLDTETTSLEATQADLIGISLAWKEDEAVYIPIGHRYLGAPEQLPLAEVLDGLRPILENPDIDKIGQNLKYDALVLRRAGIRLQGMAFDTMVASYLIFPAAKSHGLDAMAAEHLNHRMIAYSEVVGSGRNQIPFYEVEVEKATHYAAEDADVTLKLARLFAPEIHGEIKSLFDEIEMPLVEVLTEMEWGGVRVDCSALGALSGELATQLETLETRIHELAGGPFNIGSPKQLGEVLFERMGLPRGKKTKTGWSTNVEVLTKLAEDHEIAASLLEYRSLSKLKSTYTDALPKLVHPETDRIHTSFNQAVTATGRLSSSNPNLQNIPIRTENGARIREAFVPAEGRLLLAADYSQIELRILAHMADEPTLQEAFASGEDVHQRTAGEIFGVFPEMVTSEMRRQAKIINFGVLYGMGAFSLAKELGVSRKEAQAFIDNYFNRYSRIRSYIERQVDAVKKEGEALTLLGRRCAIPEIASSNGAVRSYGERNAVNYPIQGSAADIIKRAMVRIQRRLRAEGLTSCMVLQVHDELVFDVPFAEKEQVEKLVREEMENAVSLRVPLIVDVGIGKNWKIAH